MNSHTGILLSISKGCTYIASSKQKINTKSSELVAVENDMGPQVPTTTIYQDNKSTIILSENGMLSSSREPAPQCKKFFRDGQDTERRSQSDILPYGELAHRLLHQASTGAEFWKMQDIILNLPSNKIDGVHRSLLVERKNDGT